MTVPDDSRLRLNEQKRLYYQANKERIAARRKLKRELNPELERAKLQMYRAANKDKVREWNRDYYQRRKKKKAEN